MVDALDAQFSEHGFFYHVSQQSTEPYELFAGAVRAFCPGVVWTFKTTHGNDGLEKAADYVTRECRDIKIGVWWPGVSENEKRLLAR